MDSFKSFSDKINEAVKYIGFVLLAVMSVIIIIQVFSRYILGSSLSWSEESARYLFIWVVMLGASMGVKEGFHVSVTLFKEKLPVKMQHLLDILYTVILGIMAAAMMVFGWELARSVAIQLSPAIRLSMFWVYLSIPVSGLLIMIHLISRIAEIIVGLKSIDEGGR